MSARPRILVLGGTTEGREAAAVLRARGYRVLLSTVSAYAAELAADDAAVRDGALCREALAALLREHDAVVDATHPFAVAITADAIEVAAEEHRPYVRLERPSSPLPPTALTAVDHAAAAALACEHANGGAILLTTGSKDVAVYAECAQRARLRLVARVLPVPESLAACAAANVRPADVVAIQGPTSAQLDAAMLRHFGATVLVTKDSGSTGGLPAKLEAAALAGAVAIVVQRPAIRYPVVVNDSTELTSVLAEVLGSE